MKAIVISFAVLLLTGFAATASPVSDSATLKGEVLQTCQQDTTKQKVDEYKEVTLDKLNEKVQAAVKMISESYQVDKIYYNEARQRTKLLLTSKSDQSKVEIVLDNEGKKAE